MAKECQLGEAKYSEILTWPLKGVVNPDFDPQYQCTLGEVRAIVHILALEAIPQKIMDYLLETHQSEKNILKQVFSAWNGGVSEPNFAAATKELALNNLAQTLAKENQTTFNQVKMNLLIENGLALYCAKALQE